jgi:hypothetical protein
MASPVYEKYRTAVRFIDPYNDFLSARGKLWTRVESGSAPTPCQLGSARGGD